MKSEVHGIGRMAIALNIDCQRKKADTEQFLAIGFLCVLCPFAVKKVFRLNINKVKDRK